MGGGGDVWGHVKKSLFRRNGFWIVGAVKSGIQRADCQGRNSQVGTGTAVMWQNLIFFRETFILLLRSVNSLDEIYPDY